MTVLVHGLEVARRYSLEQLDELWQ